MTARTLTPRQEAIEDYRRAYEAHCEAEQIAAGTDDPDAATAHHVAALAALWAMDAEMQDPQPPGLKP